MSRMRDLYLIIYITHIMGKVNYIVKEDKVFAISGCSATLEWILWNGIDTIVAKVWNPRGIKIAWVDDIYCQGQNVSHFYCYTRKHGEVGMLYVVFINATEANSGGYTAEIKYGFQDRKNITKELVVIEKPQIRKPDRTILSEPMNISCVVSAKLDESSYRWKLNETDFNSTELINAKSSVLMFKRLWTVDKASVFSCEVCNENSCCIKSDPFSLDPYYGPYHVDLDVKENHIYLNENENFSVKCYASCNPHCSYWWEGYINSNNEELVISDFNSRKAGQYICNAQNKETDIKAKSDPIFFHLTEVAYTVASSYGHSEVYITLIVNGLKRGKRFRLRKYLMGPLIVLVFLVIVIVLILVTHWSNIISSGSESWQPCVGHTNNEASPNIFVRPNIPLPTATVQEYSLRTKRLEYPKLKRTSFQNISDQTRNIRNHARETVPLQTFPQTSNTMQSQTRKCVNNKSISEQDIYPWSKAKSTKASRQEDLFERLKGDNTVSRDEYNTGAQFQELKNPRKDNLEPQLQNDLYNTIDKDSMPVYQQRTNHVMEGTSQVMERKTELYDYAYSLGICRAETADVHVTDDTYITPVSDLAHTFAICKDEETGVLETDHIYLTLIDDLPNPTESSHVEETKMKETDSTCLTPNENVQ